MSGRFFLLSKRQKALCVGLPLFAAIAFYGPATQPSTRYEIDISISENQVLQNVIDDEIADKTQTVSIPSYEYTIQSGDSLSVIFSRLGLKYSDLMKIMEADLTLLALDTIKPDNGLSFWVDSTGSLTRMVLQLSLVDKVIYTRDSEDSFSSERITLPGTWKRSPRVGEIYGSFSQSAYRAGISSNEIEQIVSLFKNKLDFTRDIQAGDRFEIVQSQQFIDDQNTGNSELQAIKIITRGLTLSAYLHSDGQYYDQQGQSLQRAFQRYPTNKRWPITSAFNPTRLHPVTGKVSAHNGTDFSMPVGTPIVSIGDGRVEAVREHPYAGKYVVIKHDNTYSTRYLHMSRIQVSKGQTVLKGQKIGLSGQSGRVTGPHLHFELLVRDRAVNAMKADIPMATSIPKAEMTKFVASRNELDLMLQNQTLEVVSNEGPESNQS
jgi:murein DD-endopeptidase MepM/ murein hydrolase activator NlpD